MKPPCDIPDSLCVAIAQRAIFLNDWSTKVGTPLTTLHTGDMDPSARQSLVAAHTIDDWLAYRFFYLSLKWCAS
jgi:hypothetical protein